MVDESEHTVEVQVYKDKETDFQLFLACVSILEEDQPVTDFLYRDENLEQTPDGQELIIYLGTLSTAMYRLLHRFENTTDAGLPTASEAPYRNRMIYRINEIMQGSSATE